MFCPRNYFIVPRFLDVFGLSEIYMSRLRAMSSLIFPSFRQMETITADSMETVVGENVNNIKFKTDTASTASTDDDSFGWFEDFEGSYEQLGDIILEDSFNSKNNSKKSNALFSKVKSLKSPANEPPVYVLESSLSEQQLWYETAGKRPRQPHQERKYYEKLWSKNFETSIAVTETLSNCSTNQSQKSKPLKPQRVINVSNDISVITFRGKGSHSTVVSKSFREGNFSTVTIHIHLPHFRVVVDLHGKQHAEFLTVVSLDYIKFGIWRRYSNFQQLASKIMKSSKYPKTILSWKCVVLRQRWFRCLDKQYLGLKCFLLEKFIHDLVFESDSPDILYEFLGLFD